MSETSEELSSEWMQRANEFWKSRGSTMTAVRKIICETIAGNYSAFNAEDLLKECRTIDRLISLSTVYRTIKHLVEGNLLTEIEGVNEKRFYTMKLGNEIGESTLICKDCDRVFPVENPCLALREADVARKMHLTPKRVVLKIESTCNELNETGTCEHQKSSGAQSKP